MQALISSVFGYAWLQKPQLANLLYRSFGVESKTLSLSQSQRCIAVVIYIMRKGMISTT
jgi:hypothetical protein